MKNYDSNVCTGIICVPFMQSDADWHALTESADTGIETRLQFEEPVKIAHDCNSRVFKVFATHRKTGNAFAKHRITGRILAKHRIIGKPILRNIAIFRNKYTYKV